MAEVVPWPAMRAAAIPLLGAAGALATVSVCFGEGLSNGRLFWIGGAAALVALAGWGAGLLGSARLPRLTRTGAAALVAIAAFVAFGGSSMSWSVAPDLSWSFLNRGLAYLALGLVGVLVGGLVPRPAATAARGLAVLLAAALAWALLGKVFPGLVADGARVARLRNPVGYWNVLALLGAIALPLFLWIGVRRRALGALGVYAASVAILLTYSRSGLIVGAVAAAVFARWGGGRSASARVLVCSLPVALVVGGIALALPGVADDGQPRGVREADGGWFALALAAGAVAVVLLARADLPRVARRALVAAAVAVVAAGVAVLAAQGGWTQKFSGADTQVVQTASRIGSTSSSLRTAWWGESLRLFGQAPLAGKGAGTFEVVHRKVRRNAFTAREPHSLPVQLLAELGVVGLLLGLVAAGASLAAVREAMRRLDGPERAAGIALGLAVPAFLAQACFDVTWDFVAAGAPAFLAGGVLLGAARPASAPRIAPARALAGTALALAAVWSLFSPWYANRLLDDAYAALDRGDTRAMRTAAGEAHRANPFSPEPFWAKALAYAADGNVVRAVVEYERAAILQPENSRTWFNLGAYEYDVGRYERAYRDLDWSYGLDPYGPAGEQGGLLDRVRRELGR